MKKLITALAVVLIAAPAWAAVTITTSAIGAEVTVSYAVTGPNNVRAFALDITVDSGAKITSMDNFNTDYNIYPGSIVIVGGVVTDDGNAIGDSGLYAGTLGDLGTGGVTIEMASLYVGPANEPATSGVLCKFVVDKNCTISIAENTIRGGVVMENPDEDPGLIIITTSVPPPCYTGPDTTEWAAVGKPTSWCTTTQCHGDADGAQEQIGRGSFAVGYADIGILLAGFNTLYGGDPIAQPWICADFDHAYETIGRGSFPVGYNDINVLLAWFNTLGWPTDCQTATPVSP